MNKGLAILLLGILLCSCSKNKTSAEKAPPRVVTAKIEQQTVPVYIETIGQVVPTVTVNVRPQVAGKLLNVFIKQGALVQEGDLMYEVDARPYLAILEQAQAQLVHDEALLKYQEQAAARYKIVVEEDYISKLNYEQIISNLDAAKAQVELDKAAIWAAKINVDYCKVLAPVTGKISYYNVDVGNIVAVDDPNQLTVIRPLNPITILFSLPQQQFEKIRSVQGNTGEWPFKAQLPERPDLVFSGKTYFLDNQVDQNTGTILLKGLAQNKELDLWPGEFIKVQVLYTMAENALLVKPGAILIGKDGPYLYAVNEGKAEAVNVEVVTRTEEYTAIRSDKLKAGDSVIVEGQINVAPGIEVAEAPPQAS